MFYQGTNLGQTGSPVSVLEWDARSYFDALDSPKLRLSVNHDTGSVTIRNTMDAAIEIDGYSIRSASEALDPGSWVSFEDRGMNSWHEANADADQLNELNQIGSLRLNPGDVVSLGTPFRGSSIPFGQPIPHGDLAFHYTSPGEGSISGFVQYEGFNNFVLYVDPLSGEAVLQNSSPSDVAIDGYTIASPSGSLHPEDGSWNSLDDQNLPGPQWHESNASSQRLSELLFNGSTLIEAGEAISLGDLFDASAAQNLSLSVLLAGRLTGLDGIVVYRTQGDFDGNGTVDARDLKVWRASAGITADADAGFDGDTDGQDFLIWQQRLGATTAASLQNTVPEPQAWVLIGVLAPMALRIRALFR
jgi:hypothetical protein